MPHLSATPATTRFFARLDRFECECPSCGHLLFTSMDDRSLPVRLQGVSARRSAAGRTPRNSSVRKMVWNPLTQRLRCPYCRQVFVAGLVLHPLASGAHIPTDPPPDVVPTRRQLAAMRRNAGGWWAEKQRQHEEEVNWAIAHPCTCPDRGTSKHCAVHGYPDARPSVVVPHPPVDPATADPGLGELPPDPADDYPA